MSLHTYLRRIAVLGSIAIAPVAAIADEFTPAMQSYYETEIAGWAEHPSFVTAVRAQNETTMGLSLAEIEQLDQQWRAEVGSGSTPTISPVINNATAAEMRALVEASGQTVTEIILMDAQGLNVAVSSVTSDMWQGDEAKHQETYGRGAGAVHFSDIEFDESTQSYQGQISFSITDPETGDVVGAMTVGINVEALM